MEGTFDVPLFLTSDPVTQPLVPGTLSVSTDGTPVQNGVMQAPFTIAVPCAALRNGGQPLAAVVRGHGLLDSGRNIIEARDGYNAYPSLDVIAGATDWTGTAEPDQLFMVSAFSKLDTFGAFVDRQRQGVLNTLVLGRMMKTAMFNQDPAFQLPTGAGVFAGPEAEMYYGGASYGGFMGLVFAALSPDITRAYEDVGGINPFTLGQRSGEWPSFDYVFQSSGITDRMRLALVIDLINDLAAQSLPEGYVTHITSNPLPGTNAKQVLMTMSWFDEWTANLMTEVAARSLGLASLQGSLRTDVPQIPDQAGPLASALVIYDTGVIDPANPAHVPLIPPLANLPAPAPILGDCDPHWMRIIIPAAAQQLQAFFQPGGMVENFCHGRCDAGDPFERPGGAAEPCDPLAMPGE